MQTITDNDDGLTRSELDSSVSMMTLYTTYVGTMEKVSDRRATLNAWMITLLNALAALDVGMAKFSPSTPISVLIVPLVGITTCIVWRSLLNSFSLLNCAKFKVISDLEHLMGVQPFRLERRYYKEQGRVGFAKLEANVPLAFLFIFIAMLAIRVIDISV